MNLTEVFFWATISVLGIIFGSFIGTTFKFKHNSIAKTMAIAAGLLIAAATIELVVEAIKDISLYVATFAFIFGALGFSLGNNYLNNLGAKNRKRCGECASQLTEEKNPGSGLAITLGTAMDAIPESIVLGITFFTFGVNYPLILAIALGNLPEALSGSVGMLHAGRKKNWIYKIWFGVAILSISLTVVGFLLAESLSPSTVSFLQLFGAGALIAMVSETLIPEAFHDSPKYSGTLVAIGFLLLLIINITLNTH